MEGTLKLEVCSMPHFVLLINGQQQAFEAETAMPLLWVLRDILNLTGTKYGCGMGLCGACTVHLDGQAVRSCQIPVSTIGQRSVTTIEGVVREGGQSLQESWIKHQVPQCGYCQPGQIMQASALFKKNPRPTSQQITQTMTGNICRCATYQRIRRAMEQVAEKTS
jgi:isoquinoline 1-oxidoreductase subunit alpha